MKPFNKLLFLPLLIFFLLVVVPATVLAQFENAGLANAIREAKGAGIPDATLKRLLAPGPGKQQIEPASLANMLSLLSEAKRNDLPLDPFVNKIEEGMAKKVPASAIEQVLRKRMEDYQFTRSLLTAHMQKQGSRQRAASEDLIGLTESLYSGLSRQDLSRMAEQAPAAPVSNLHGAANALASLKQIGLDPKLSDQIIFTGLKKNFFTPQQRDFARAVAASKRKGIPDTQITAAALAAMENTGMVTEFRSRMGITDAEMGHGGPKVGPPGASMGGMGQSSGMGSNGMGSGMGGGMGRGGGGMGGGMGRGGGGGMGGGMGRGR